MKEIVVNEDLVAFCGLYCGACGKYLHDQCPGCKENEKAGWCQIRKCCIGNKYLSCADCRMMGDAADCKKFNNFISKIFALIFRSNRRGCINMIKEKGYRCYAAQMTNNKRISV